jgi:hypothetical protein
MKKFKLNAHGTTYDVTVKLSKYNNDRIAIQLIDVSDGMPYATATVNMPNVLLEDNEVLVKDYSENGGMLEFLMTNNIVTPTMQGVHAGHVWFPVATVNDESVWGEVPNLYSIDEHPEYDSTGFTRADNTMSPPPDEIDINTGKSMWTIKDYRIWADTYEQALEILPLIENA